MKTRAATLTDLEQLSKLFDAYRVFYRKESDINAGKKFISERLKQKDSELFVCETAEGQLAGFVQLYPLFSSTRMQRLWLLNDLYVDPKHRGQQVSVQLIEASKRLAQASGACGLILETEKSNLIGNNLYPKTGFKRNEGSNFYEWYH